MEEAMNANEKLVAAHIERRGFSILSRGWPDFLCVKKEVPSSYGIQQVIGKGVMCVEVKAGKDDLSKEQRLVHTILKAAGLPVYTVRAEDVAKKRNYNTRKFLTHSELQAAQGKLWELTQRVKELEKIIEDSSAILEYSDANISSLLGPQTCGHVNDMARF
jgi:hypothetical protein